MTLPMTGKNCSLALKWLISFAIPLIVYWAMPIDGKPSRTIWPSSFPYDMGNLHLGYGCNE